MDNDRIYAMYEKLSKRALLNEVDFYPNRMKICINDKETTKIHILADEPGDYIISNLNAFNNIENVKTSWYEEKVEKEHERTVNILDTIQKSYQS